MIYNEIEYFFSWFGLFQFDLHGNYRLFSRDKLVPF